MTKSKSDPIEIEIPVGPITDEEVIAGIRRLAYGASSETVSLRGWELLGKIIALFRESPTDGGAPVIRLTPELSQLPVSSEQKEEEVRHDDE